MTDKYDNVITISPPKAGFITAGGPMVDARLARAITNKSKQAEHLLKNILEKIVVEAHACRSELYLSTVEHSIEDLSVIQVALKERGFTTELCNTTKFVPGAGNITQKQLRVSW